MLASRIVFLAVGLGLGLALGLLLREEPASGRPPPPRVVPEVVTVREPAPAPVPVEAPRAETVAVAVTPLPDPVAPAVPVPEEEELPPGIGELIVDFSKTDWPDPLIHVEGRLLEGGRVRHQVKAGRNGLAQVEMLAGTHTISWPEGGDSSRRRVLNVVIRAGWTTRIDVTDPDLPRLDPIGDGLGRLDISVADLGGGPLREALVYLHGREFHGGEQTLDRPTNEAGRVRFDVLPGRYLVDVGLRQESAVVRAGARTVLDIHYRDEGALVVEGGLPGGIGIAAVGGSGRIRSRAWGSGISEHHFVYLPPGDYYVTYQAGGRFAGRATVRSGQITPFRHDPPTGSLLLNIVFPASKKRQHISVQVHEVTSGLRVGLASNYVRDGLSYPLQWLAPGTYRVRIKGRTFEDYEAEVTVGSTSVVRRVDLVAKD